MTSNEKTCLKAILGGMSYKVAARKFHVSPSDLKNLIESFLKTHVPEMLASLKSDGKITVTELRQHSLYLSSILDMEGV